MSPLSLLSVSQISYQYLHDFELNFATDLLTPGDVGRGANSARSTDTTFSVNSPFQQQQPWPWPPFRGEAVTVYVEMIGLLTDLGDRERRETRRERS